MKHKRAHSTRGQADVVNLHRLTAYLALVVGPAEALVRVDPHLYARVVGVPRVDM